MFRHLILRLQDLAYIHEILKNIFLVFPNYCLGRGLMDIAFNEYHNEFYFKMGKTNNFRLLFIEFAVCISSRLQLFWVLIGRLGCGFHSCDHVLVIHNFSDKKVAKSLHIYIIARPVEKANWVACVNCRVDKGSR